ncbi:MAG: Gfo/Idh/MocA family oxidoreductase [Phycisphaerales bacterium]
MRKPRPRSLPVHIQRREFIAAAAGAFTLPWIVPARALGNADAPAASERLALGLIGCGGMGRADLAAFLGKRGVEVVAVCDPDRARTAAARADVEKASTGRGAATPRCDEYVDFRELLARPDIDAVIIASPDHWHALHVVHAVRAGKDVYGEKPLALTVREGRAMSDAVRRHARVFQTGSQQRSDARFRKACELVRNGRLGKIQRIVCGLPAGETTGDHPPRPVPEGFDYELWLGPAPWAPYCDERTHYVFRHILDYSGGKLTDWGAHHIDIAQWALGTTRTGPTQVSGRGLFPGTGLWNAAVQYDIECRYADGTQMLVTSNAPNGVRFEGERGWLFVTRGGIDAGPRSILDERVGPGETRLTVSNDHHQDFLDAVKSRRATIAPIEEAHRSITIAHLGNIAMRTGRSIRWDSATETIDNDAGASAMLQRTMRGPWML